MNNTKYIKIEMTNDEIDTYIATHNPHHTATAAGYISRRLARVIEPYNGRFGRGFVARYPRYDTTRYHTVEYYIFEGVAK